MVIPSVAWEQNASDHDSRHFFLENATSGTPTPLRFNLLMPTLTQKCRLTGTSFLINDWEQEFLKKMGL
ncbi:MAG: hypothetical protein WCW30_02545, partial [Candidatus Gracilibacteria bacterium]